MAYSHLPGLVLVVRSLMSFFLFFFFLNQNLLSFVVNHMMDIDEAIKNPK